MLACVIDAAAFALAVLWTIEGRYWWIIALAVVASTNRESSLFLSLLWMVVQGVNTGLSRRLFVEAFVLGIVATATVMGRPMHGGRWDRPITRTQGAIVLAAILMAGLSAIGGAAEELRIYIPAITVTIVAGAAS